MKLITYFFAGVTLLTSSCRMNRGQNENVQTDVNTSLHLLQPAYKVPYGTTTSSDVSKVLNRVLVYLESVTPAKVIDQKTNEEVVDLNNLPEEPAFAKGDYRLTSYEWGVTYSGMLNAAEATGDDSYSKYVSTRLDLLSRLYPICKKRYAVNPNAINPERSMIAPGALDDCGALCAGFIKAHRAGLGGDIRPVIDHFIQYITTQEFRLTDGTLARNRPLPNTIWLDDLFMSVPALAQMGKLTGEVKYYDEAVKQVLQFSQRMFVAEKGLYMHG